VAGLTSRSSTGRCARRWRPRPSVPPGLADPVVLQDHRVRPDRLLADAARRWEGQPGPDRVADDAGATGIGRVDRGRRRLRSWRARDEPVHGFTRPRPGHACSGRRFMGGRGPTRRWPPSLCTDGQRGPSFESYVGAGCAKLTDSRAASRPTGRRTGRLPWGVYAGPNPGERRADPDCGRADYVALPDYGTGADHGGPPAPRPSATLGTFAPAGSGCRVQVRGSATEPGPDPGGPSGGLPAPGWTGRWLVKLPGRLDGLPKAGKRSTGFIENPGRGRKSLGKAAVNYPGLRGELGWPVPGSGFWGQPRIPIIPLPVLAGRSRSPRSSCPSSCPTCAARTLEPPRGRVAAWAAAQLTG